MAQQVALRKADWDASITARLCIMMFLQFFAWGAWFVTVGNYLAATKMEVVAWVYSVGPIAAIISPFFLGMIADRFFATQKVLAVLCLLTGLGLAAAPAAAGKSQWAFVAVLMFQALCFMPTLGLTNTLAFHNLTNQEKQFPLIRVFGTFGWIAAGLVISFLGLDRSAGQFYIAGGAAVILAVFSLLLPNTPPPAAGKKISAREILGLDALVMLKKPAFLVFMICSFLICIPLAAYFSYGQRFVGDNGVVKVGATMSVGQMAEVVFMFLMPVFFAYLGVKWMLLGGMLAWVLRYGMFAAATSAGSWGMPSLPFTLIVLGIAMHGFCYDFFFVTGFIYTDKRVSKEIRGQAQGLLVLVTQGLGMLIGAQLSQWLFDKIVGKAVGAASLPLYQKFWVIPCVLAAVVFVLFGILFKDDGHQAETTAEKKAEEIAQV